MKKNLLIFAVAVTVAPMLWAEDAKPAEAAGSDVVEWKPIDNRKGFLVGAKLFPGDLAQQPVIVCRFDPSVEVPGEDREGNTEKYMRLSFGEGDEFPPRFQVINVPTKPLKQDDMANLLKKGLYKTAAVPGFPWYSDLVPVQEPENAANQYPFYYVISSDRKVAYAGCNANAAIGAMMKDIRSRGKCDPLTGYVVPSVHEAITAQLTMGSDVTKVVNKLKPFAAAKEEGESKTEAQALMDAIDQSKNYWLRVINGLSSHNPPLALILGQQAMKTFPRNKAMFQEVVGRLKSRPEVAATSKMYEKLLACKEKMPEKKSDVLKAYQIACNAEKMCAKARKDFGGRLPGSFISLENLVMTIKAELEATGLTPQPKN